MWEEYAKWIWMTVLGLLSALVGIVFRGIKAEVKENREDLKMLDRKLDAVNLDKVSKQDFETTRKEHNAEMKEISRRLREDIQGVHKKLDRLIERL